MAEYFDFWRLLAGLGIFLYGMQQLEVSLKQLSGSRFRRFLRHTTKTPLTSVLSGIVTTVIVQSSSLVGLIVLALVGAAIIPLKNAIGVVIGANLGTTFTGWIVATIGFKMDLAAATLPLLGIAGIGLALLQGQLRIYAQLIFGLALILMGLGFMKESVATLSGILDINVLSGYPLIAFLLVGVVFTVIIQSSSAAMMITLSALNADIIPLPAAAALVIGADLGTTSTVLIGSLQGAVVKRQVALAHILFNLSVDTLAFIALYPLLELLDLFEITDPLYSLVAIHSAFNLLGILLFLPIITPFTNFLQRCINTDERDTNRYIANVPSNITDVAVEAMAKECLGLIHQVAGLILRFMDVKFAQVDKRKVPMQGYQEQLTRALQLNKLAHYEQIKFLEGKIVSYSLEMQTQPLDKHTAETIDRLLDTIRHAVYSSKCLKDIDANLRDFADHDNAMIKREFAAQQQFVLTFYQQIYRLLQHPLHSDVFMEEMHEISTFIEAAYHTHHKNLYSDGGHSQLDTPDLSTLLNVNKEVYSSCTAYYQAFYRFWIKNSLQQFVKS